MGLDCPPSVLGLIALGIVGIVAFILIEIRMKDEALIPMRLFSTAGCSPPAWSPT